MHRSTKEQRETIEKCDRKDKNAASATAWCGGVHVERNVSTSRVGSLQV